MNFKYTLTVLDNHTSFVTNSDEVAQAWAIFCRLIGFNKYYIVERFKWNE